MSVLKTTKSLRDLILLQDRQIVIFNKPGAVPSSNDLSGDTSLFGMACAYFKRELYLINRLDRPASGVILLAKTLKSAQLLNEQLRRKTIVKKYLAVVQGHPIAGEQTLINHLFHDKKKNKSYVVDPSHPLAKSADLSYRVVQSIDRYSLLEITLISGRFHQIRAQLAHLGHPIFGDVKYGFRRGNKDRTIALHASHLSLQHPTSSQRVSIDCKPPDANVWSHFNLDIFQHGT